MFVALESLGKKTRINSSPPQSRWKNITKLQAKTNETEILKI